MVSKIFKNNKTIIINLLYKKIIIGNPEYHIPSLDPLHVDEMFVNQGNTAVSIKIKIFNADVMGIKDAQFTKVRYKKLVECSIISHKLL